MPRYKKAKKIKKKSLPKKVWVCPICGNQITSKEIQNREVRTVPNGKRSGYGLPLWDLVHKRCYDPQYSIKKEKAMAKSLSPEIKVDKKKKTLFDFV